jgi:hypothetical protein
MPILARALRDDVRHHAVDSDRRNRDAEEAEEARQAHVDAALGYELREVVLERLDFARP